MSMGRQGRASLRSADGVQVLDAAEVLVGRDSSNDIQLESRTTDHHHARFVYSAKKKAFILEDLGSLNGTFVNDVKIRGPVVLQDCDFVRFGWDGQSRRVEYAPSTPPPKPHPHTAQPPVTPRAPAGAAPSQRLARRRLRAGDKQARVGDLMKLEPHEQPVRANAMPAVAVDDAGVQGLDNRRAAEGLRNASKAFRLAQRRRHLEPTSVLLANGGEVARRPGSPLLSVTRADRSRAASPGPEVEALRSSLRSSREQAAASHSLLQQQLQNRREEHEEHADFQRRMDMLLAAIAEQALEARRTASKPYRHMVDVFTRLRLPVPDFLTSRLGTDESHLVAFLQGHNIEHKDALPIVRNLCTCLNELEKTNDGIRHLFQGLESRAEVPAASHFKRLRQQVVDLESQLDQERRKLREEEASHAELDRARSRATELTAELGDCRRELQSARRDAQHSQEAELFKEQLLKAVHDRNKLQTQLAAANDELADLRAKMRRKEARVADLTGTVSALEGRSQDMQGQRARQLAERDGQVARLEAELADAVRRAQTLEDSQERDQRQRREQDAAAAADSDARVARLRAEVAALTSRAVELEETGARATARVATIERDRDDLRAALEASRLETQRSRQQAKLELERRVAAESRPSTARSDRDAEVGRLRAKLQDAEATADRVRSEAERLGGAAALATAQRALEQAQARATELEALHAADGEATHTLKARLRGSEADAQLAQTRLRQAELARTETERQAVDLRTQVEGLEATLAEVLGENERLREQPQAAAPDPSLQAEVELLRTQTRELSGFAQRASELQGTVDSLRQQVAVRDGSIRDLTARHQRAEEEAGGLRHSTWELSQQLQTASAAQLEAEAKARTASGSVSPFGVEALRAERAALTAQVATLTRDLSALRSTHDRFVEQVGARAGLAPAAEQPDLGERVFESIDALTKSRLTLMTQVAEEQRRCKLLQDEVNRLKRELSQLRERDFSGLQAAQLLRFS